MLPAPLERGLYGFMVSHVLFAADDVGLFKYLIRSGAQEPLAVAEALGTEPDATGRLLAAAVAAGLLEKSGERYAVPEALRAFLDEESPLYQGHVFAHFRGVSTRTFALLPEAIREGRPQLKRALSAAEESTFEVFYQGDDRKDAFARAMWGMGFEAGRDLTHKYDMGKHRHLCDVGGGSGSFAVAALLSTPSLKATVMDLPPMEPYVARASEEHGLTGRLSFVAGDFFKDELPPADVYSLGYILSDWTTAEGQRLLAKIFRALPEGGAVLILERLFDEDGCGPLPTALMNLCMLLETAGRHRSAAEYVDLLKSVGFARFSVIRSIYEKHMVVGYKD